MRPYVNWNLPMNFLISAGRELHCSAPSFRLGVAAPAQPEAARRASQSRGLGRTKRGSWILEQNGKASLAWRYVALD
jgi:hypothetical protein